MKRKILCVFFAVLFVVYLIPTNVFADDDSSYQEVEEGINLGQSSINDDFSKVFLKENGSKDFSKKSSKFL